MKKNSLLILLSYFLISTSFAGQPTVTPTIIKSDKINKESGNIIRAVGDVEIKKDGRILKAKEVEYNQDTKIIKANSEVKVYTDKEENVFFSETGKMSDDFKNADFYNGILIFQNGSDIKSPHIKKMNDTDLYLYNSNYSICPTDKYNIDLDYKEVLKQFDNEEIPLFSLRSKKVIGDTEKKELELWGTSVWVWRIPVFYLPYLKTGLSFKNELNGFGIPGIEHSSNYGYGIYIPYRYRTKQQYLLLKPKIYQDGNYLLNTKYKIESKEADKWKLNFKGDITNDKNQSEELTNAYGVTELEEGDYKIWRGFVSTDGYYKFNDLWNFDYNVMISGDEYYLRDYYQNTLSYIQSNLSFTRINMKEIKNFNYFQFDNLFYQELLEDDSEYNTPRYVPITNFNMQDTISKNQFSNLYYKIKINTTDLFRNYSAKHSPTIEYNRATIIPSLNNTLNTKFGDINTNLELKTDIYVINEVNVENELYDNNENRVLPQLNVTWKKNFLTNNFSFQPIIKYSGTPNSESFENKIPNEDSETQIINFENIFSNNRLAGYDRQEFGNRITYGFESSLLNNLNFGIAQGYRDNIKHDDSPIVGFDYNAVSDYVGYFSLIINDNFDLYYKFLADKDNFDLKNNEAILNFNLNDFSAYISYLNMDPNLLYSEKQQQINLGTSFKMFYKWKISLSAILDIEHNNRLLESGAGLVYDGGCTVWEINYKTSNPLSETEKNTSISLDFKIKFL